MLWKNVGDNVKYVEFVINPDLSILRFNLAFLSKMS